MSHCIACEGIGSVPRPDYLQSALANNVNLEESLNKALLDTISMMEEAVGHDKSISITDGEQTKPSFITYPISKITTLNPSGVVINFTDGHTRVLPTITESPFKYTSYAVEFLRQAKAVAPPGRLLKQAVISASAMSLLYPATGIEGYSQTQFNDDVVSECIKDIRQCLDEGAHVVQMDMTEARLALKLDPSGGLLTSLLAINERVFSSFSEEERKKLGIHVCPGADSDSTHSADVEYTALLPTLLTSLSCGSFYIQLKSEKDPLPALAAVRDNLRPHQRVFVGCTDVNDPRIETPEEVCSFLETASKYIPVSQLGACDDCGFSPFADDISTARDIAFAKIKARVDGTKLASAKLLPSK